MAFLEPITVTILSGHEPSDMFILAPLWKQKKREHFIIVNKDLDIMTEQMLYSTFFIIRIIIIKWNNYDYDIEF